MRYPRWKLVAPWLTLALWLGLAHLLAASPTPRIDTTQDTLATLRIMVTHDGDPLAEAMVRAGDEESVTDGAGRSLLRLAAGRHVVVASRIGFSPDSVAVTLAAGQDTSVTITLAEAGAELEELVVHSTRSTRRLEEQPLRVEVLAQEEVEEKVMMTPGDISMMLNESGGMRVQNTSPSLGGANVRIQGLRGRYSLLLSDGLPLYGQAGGLGLLQVPPVDLGQVEVIKGASSALYGSSALGGVINLISKQPTALPATGAREVLLNGTSLGGTDAVLFAGGRASDAWSYTLLAGGHRQNRVDRDDDGWTDVPGYERLVLRPRVFWNDGTGHSLFITGGATLEDRDGGTMDGALAPDGTTYVEALRTERFDLGALGRFELGAGWLLTARVSGMTQQHDHTFGEDLEHDRHSTAFGEATASRSTVRAVTVLGLAWQGDVYRNQELPAFDYDYSVPGVFVHEEWTASERVTLAGSVRLDHHSTYGIFLSPLLSALVRLGGTWTMRGSAGTGFYGPTPFTEETEVTGLSRLLPLSGLRGEKARSGSVDIGGLLGPFEVNATVFGSVIDRAVQLRAAVDGFELFNAEGPTRAYGGELLARYRRAPWHLTASYTYTRASESTPEAPGERREVSLTPRHSVGVVGMWEAEGRTRVGVEFYYTGIQSLDDNPYRATSEPYVIMGLLAEQRVGPARLFVNFENLLDVRQTKHDPLVLPARAPDGRWTTDAWAPLEGRVVNGGVRLEF